MKLIDSYFPASIAAKEQFFRLVVFNYLLSNGDAHLKNFSRLDCEGNNDGVLAPAYDLINTKLHIDDSDLALKEGLYEGDYNYQSYNTLGYYAFDDFYEFGLRIGMLPTRVKRFIKSFLLESDTIAHMIERSFLNTEAKNNYSKLYTEKLKRLTTSTLELIDSQ